jgi:intracellular proteinase inhibitor BsuPI
MRLGFTVATALLLSAGSGWAQEGAPSPTAPGTTSAAVSQSPTAAPAPEPLNEPAPPRRSLFGRLLHPFSGGPKSEAPVAPRDPKLRGLSLVLEVSPQPVKLSEIRQLDVKATLTNRGKKAVELSFGTDQRIEIYLMNTSDTVLTKWSENHAITNKPGTVLINPGEHIEYNEKISTRELTRDKVFVAEVFFPQYPELRARQKFLTAP